MSDLTVRPLGPHHYAVTVTESGGSPRTDHEVTVDDRFLDDAGLIDLDRPEEERLVRDSVGFLLEREPATSIEHTFALSDLAGRYADFLDEMGVRRA